MQKKLKELNQTLIIIEPDPNRHLVSQDDCHGTKKVKLLLNHRDLVKIFTGTSAAQRSPLLLTVSPNMKAAYKNDVCVSCAGRNLNSVIGTALKIDNCID